MQGIDTLREVITASSHLGETTDGYDVYRIGMDLHKGLLSKFLYQTAYDHLRNMLEERGEYTGGFNQFHLMVDVADAFGSLVYFKTKEGKVDGLMVFTPSQSLHCYRHAGAFVFYNVRGSLHSYFRLVRKSLRSLGHRHIGITQYLGNKTYSLRYLNI